MKGHLYSDLILSKFTITFASLYTISFLFILLFDNNNFQGADALIMPMFLLLLWTNGGIFGIVMSKGKIRQFAVTFPQGKSGYVLCKYLFCLLMSAVGILFGVICLFLLKSDIKFGTILSLINISFILLWIQLVFVLIFDESVLSATTACLCGVALFAATAYILFGNLTFLVNLKAEDVDKFFARLGDNMSVYSTIANVAVLAATFPLSCRFVSLDGGK